MRTWHRQIIPIALLIAGIDLWSVHSELGSYGLLEFLGALLLISAIWPLSNRIATGADWIDRWLQRWHWPVAILIALLTAAHLFYEAHHFAGGLYYKFHDEYVYMIQAHMLAHGRLWMPPFPPALRDFFDGFYLIMDRVYAPMYTPGTAIMMLPAVWLGLHHWVMPILTGSTAAVFLYLVLAEIFGSVRAIVGVLLLICLNLFMSMSFMVMSEMPLVLAELVCFWAWMRWRKSHAWCQDNTFRPVARWPFPSPGTPGEGERAQLARVRALEVSSRFQGPHPDPLPEYRERGKKDVGSPRAWRWLILLGLAGGYGAITRSADMFCVALAIAIAIVFELRKQPAILLRTVSLIFLGATPFIAIQVIQNIGITGRWDQTPVRYYTDRNYPAPILSFAHVDASNVPITNCLPKQVAMKQWILPAYEQHWRLSLWEIWYPDRINEILHRTLANPLLVILIPLAIWSLGDIRAMVIIGAMLFFLVIYTADPLFLNHYSLAIAPAMICLILLGWRTLEQAFRWARGPIFTFLAVGIAAMALRAAPEFNPLSAPMGTGSDETAHVDQILATLPREPALVMFRFAASLGSYHSDAVYNADVAWPADAMIVRARDLGASENVRLYHYFSRLGQNRTVYLYDPQALKQLSRLGTVRQLAHD